MPHDSMRIFSEKVMFLEISTSSDRPVPLTTCLKVIRKLKSSQKEIKTKTFKKCHYTKINKYYRQDQVVLFYLYINVCVTLGVIAAYLFFKKKSPWRY